MKYNFSRYGATSAFGSIAVGCLVYAFPSYASMIILLGSFTVGAVCAFVVVTGENL